MAIIVEDGSGLVDSNSYIDEAYLIQYALDRGVTITSPTDQYLYKAMDYLESLNYIGYKFTKEQALQWPRGDVFIDGYAFPDDSIPKQLMEAQAEAAMATFAGQDPTSDPGRATKKEKLDVMEVEYMDGDYPYSVIRSISLKLNKLLVSSMSMMARTVRG